MPVIRIPSGFEPVVQGYGFKGPGGVKRTMVAGGLPRYALDWDRGSSEFNVALVMTAAKFAVWTAFYHLIIKKGSITFTMPLDSGLGLQDHDCNILPDSYMATRTNGPITTVTFSVDATPRIYETTAAEAQELIDFWNSYGESGSSLLAAIAYFATVGSNALAYP